jgi:hypothetical protein
VHRRMGDGGCRRVCGVRTICTAIDIDRPAAVVWAILTDIDTWPAWNPFAKASGRLAMGKTLQVEIRPPGKSPMTFRPTVVKLDPGVELRWLGHLVVPGLFDGEHGFRIEAAGDERCRFRQFESFKGVLSAPLLWLVGDATRRGFEAMNLALKTRAEGA